MSKSNPSLLALLGLVAVAGYQHRDKIRDMLSDGRHAESKPTRATGQSGGGFLDEIRGMFQGGSGGSAISGGLSELIDRFNGGGRGSRVDSWVSDRVNEPVEERDLEDVLGDDTIAELTEKTGLTRGELLQRLTANLPEAVNGMTPAGRLPTPDEAAAFERDETGTVRMAPPTRQA